MEKWINVALGQCAEVSPEKVPLEKPPTLRVKLAQER